MGQQKIIPTRNAKRVFAATLVGVFAIIYADLLLIYRGEQIRKLNEEIAKQDEIQKAKIAAHYQSKKIKIIIVDVPFPQPVAKTQEQEKSPVR